MKNGWVYVSRIGRVTLIGKPIKWLIQFLCGLRGHSYDGDWGYGGGDFADVWCRHCNYFTQVHKTSIWFKSREAKSLMEMVGKENQ